MQLKDDLNTSAGYRFQPQGDGSFRKVWAASISGRDKSQRASDRLRNKAATMETS